MIRLNLGCGDKILDDYINVDLYNELAEVKADVIDLPFPDGYADEVLSSHVIEHFDFHEGMKALKEWHRILKDGGKLVVECPNLLALCEIFIKADEAERVSMYPQFFGSPWIPGHLHKFVYTPAQMYWTLESLGFKDIRQVLPQFYWNITDRCMRFECNK